MSKYNDIDLKNWKEYEEVLTDSLWIINKRDNSGVHSGKYHGNFVPQIPHQFLTRYTKKGDWVLDPFIGSGTTMIEAQRMGRNCIGIDLSEDIIRDTYHRVLEEKNDTIQNLYVGDSRNINIGKIIEKINVKSFQYMIYHPPYWDIIHFSNNENDISNSKTLEDFLDNFGKVIDNTIPFLDKNRYCSVVIGDKYANSEIVPLGFHCMNLMLSKGLLLKAILVKNFEETKGKSNQQGIWRYRALASDFYIFKHEYIFVFKKVK